MSEVKSDKAILSPPPCWGSFVASTRDTLFLWGGRGDAVPETVYIYSLNTETWMREFTEGPHPPAGLENGGCTLAGQCIYLYGGSYESSYSGSLYELNTDNFTWSRLSNDGGPLRKEGCRMITYKDQVLVVGGDYNPDEVFSEQPGSRYEGGFTNELHSYSLSAESWSSPSVKGSRPPPCAYFSLTMIDEEHAVMFGGRDHNFMYLNDVYILHMSTMFCECLPCIHGDPWPEGRVDHIAVCLGYGGQYKKVLVSGGYGSSVGEILSDAWLLDPDPQSWRWEEVAVSNKKLLQRCGHSAASFTISPECMEVVLFGGKKKLFESLIADTAVLRFGLEETEAAVPIAISPPSTINSGRNFSSNSSPNPFDLSSPQHSSDTLSSDEQLADNHDETEDKDELQDFYSSGEKNWILTDVAVHTQLGSPKRLDDKRRMMESFGTCSDGGVDDRMRRLQQQLEEIEIRAQASDRRAEESDRRAEESDRRAEVAGSRVGQLERELAVGRESLQRNTRKVQLAQQVKRRCEQYLQECTQEKTLAREQQRVCEQHIQDCTWEMTSARERLRECEQHIQERTREVTSAREQLRESERRLTASTSHWIVRTEEVEMTGPELGRGGWAIVSVATFRGVRVAAKTIHRQIISHHNVQLFRREMNMAAKLRHPNLVQFIGATIEGNMVILTELMPTSLRAQLQRDIYLQPKVVMSVSLDVARALNYLHQMQPDPIIHRDISSANVLLEPLQDWQWRAKLSDYGTVNLFHQLETVNPGSPVYAAPEANNPRLQSTKMDIYSFGALMLEMLTGQLPTPEDRPALLLKVQHDQLLDLIRRCLSERAQDRPDAATFIGELTN